MKPHRDLLSCPRDLRVRLFGIDVFSNTSQKPQL
jgi:hypothetical protein